MAPTEPDPVPMTGAERRILVEAIHASEIRLVLAVAGGGNAVITDLLDVPGASRTVLEVRVPYAREALDELVADHPPAARDTGAVSPDMADAMALACRTRAQHLVGESVPADRLIGVACSAALVTDRQRRGDHRAHIAIAGSDGISREFVELAKGELDRRAEDRLVADVVLAAIATAMGIAVSEVSGAAERR